MRTCHTDRKAVAACEENLFYNRIARTDHSHRFGKRIFMIRRGRIELMTGFPGWGDIAIQEELEQKFCIPVFVGHDANAGVLAQYWHNLESALASIRLPDRSKTPII